MWSKIRKVLGVITDVLLVGRAREWWSERHKPISLKLNGKKKRR